MSPDEKLDAAAAAFKRQIRNDGGTILGDLRGKTNASTNLGTDVKLKRGDTFYTTVFSTYWMESLYVSYVGQNGRRISKTGGTLTGDVKVFTHFVEGTTSDQSFNVGGGIDAPGDLKLTHVIFWVK